MKTKINRLLMLLLLVFSSCKQDFLDKRPSKSLLVPTTLNDFQALLDNSAVLNVAPYLPILGTDDYYTTDNGYKSNSPLIQKSYLWEPEQYSGTSVSDWDKSYVQIFYANIVLDGLDKVQVTDENRSLFNSIKGSALFFRAQALYNLAQQFSATYTVTSSVTDPGIPIRLNADVNERPGRGTVEDTYHQIEADLLAAEPLLPLSVAYKTRPQRAAADALLARMYLVMGKYNQAGNYADAALKLNSSLIDYNFLTGTTSSSANPFPGALALTNDEVLFYSAQTTVTFLAIPSVAIIDSVLYASYNTNDLRKAMFFRDKGSKVIVFKGNYTGTITLFAGLATDELYLIRAECHARINQTDLALQDLNTLLIKRWRSNSFTPYTATSAEDALAKILSERRKEMVYRNIRWSDLRRLNKDPRFALTQQRLIEGKTYRLPPDDKRYVLAIPDNEIRESGIKQNDRE